MNPVDSRRGAKVRGFLKEPRPAATFFFAGRGAQLRSIWECKSTGKYQRSKRTDDNNQINQIASAKGYAPGSLLSER